MLFLFAVCLFTSLLSTNCQKPSNERPIIGVLTEEFSSNDEKSFIVASYVKFLEAGGARVVPIWIYKPKEYYEVIMSKLNGVLLPGAGGGGHIKSKGYGKSGEFIFDIATKMNDQGDFFPLWGTCLGFEKLNYEAANKRDFMKKCVAQDFTTSIEFSNGYKNSRMFQDLESNMETSMRKQDVAIHYHHWCLTPENYTLSGLNKYFKVLALNRDLENTIFVSIIEAFKYPFYGVAFHPEKVLFEWVFSKTHHNIPHNIDAIRTSQYFANFYVNEARKSDHHFPNKGAEDDVLIYNYSTKFTGKLGTNPYTQMYYFPQK